MALTNMAGGPNKCLNNFITLNNVYQPVVRLRALELLHEFSHDVVEAFSREGPPAGLQQHNGNSFAQEPFRFRIRRQELGDIPFRGLGHS